MNHFKEAPLFFNYEEQTSLIHAAIFAEEAGYYGGEALHRALPKLSNYSNQAQETKINHHVTSLEVMSQVRPLSIEPLLKVLEQAVADGFSVTILYYKSNEKQCSDRLIDPYKLIYWKNKWYVIGFCHLRKEIRSFRVDRIEHLSPSQKKFNRPEHFSAHDYFFSSSGRYFKNGIAPLNVITVGATKETITTMGGLRIAPDLSLDECTFEDTDLLILPGGSTWSEEIHQAILERAEQALQRGTIVAAICGATDALANRGCLNTRKHTSNNLAYTKMMCPNYKGETFYQLEVAVADDNVVTASGVAPLDLQWKSLKNLMYLHQIHYMHGITSIRHTNQNTFSS
ncbi:DeoR family transcriptional regulator [Fictibacillus macauensis ZFHKF-1]|uniref:DeoR family transcriptional regulator n=1 Tax=Fictibacillus macauensis ZFHKF-1 TaxID=1196324 RepID=I8J4J3_9BACL|nr:DeoR family transcriptional regulator [Fictibacillus macauensis ZFHKF-1]